MDASPHAKPAVFQALSFADASASAERDQRLLVVDATASWCAPCQTMDRTTWVDPNVVDWLRQHALAIQIDVDAQEDLAKQLGIRSMPTVIAFQSGKELDRVVGAKTPGQLLEWLDGLTRGERSVDRIRMKVSRAEAATGNKDIAGRVDLANALLLCGELDEATKEYRWLWSHMLAHGEEHLGTRWSFLPFDMASLAQSFEPAREAFADLRRETAERLSTTTPRPTDRMDWLVLNRIPGDTERNLEWFDQMRATPHAMQRDPAVVYELEELLFSRGRWSDVASLYPDPLAWLERQIGMLTMDLSSVENPPDLRAMLQQMFRASAGRLYAVLLAAGRDDEARRVAEEARRAEPSPEMVLALVATACDADRRKEVHRSWLDAPEVRDLPETAELRKRLDS
jgi:thiol-disulfide isomerase/thioredoxin